jgi:uncharacterized membrane protein YbhN (UPF0104 family)
MRWKSVLVSVAVAAVLYLTLFAGTDADAALASAARMTWEWWLMILALSLINYALRFVRWDGYLRHLGHRLPVLRHMTIYLAGFALTTTPAKAGEAIRALYLLPLGVAVRRCIATVYAERVVDVISMALLAVLLYQLAAPPYRWLAVIAAGAAGVLLLVQHGTCLGAAGALVVKLPWQGLRRAARHGIDCLREASALLRGRILFHGIVIGVLSWGAEAVAFYLVLRELDIPVDLPGAVGIYATAMLAGALSFVPGGLGGTEAVMASLLILGGAPPPSAVAATTIIRVATLWFAVALGMVCLLVTEAAGRRDAATAVSATGGERAGT